MKRAIAIMLAVFMLLSVCSCGSNTANIEDFAEVTHAATPCDVDTTGKVKIMCTGDSLTAGYRKTNAYRNYLADQLIDNGYQGTTCFVGPFDSPIDLCPEGYRRLYAYGGNTIPGLQGQLSTAMSCDPDIIILMIGTNDLAGFLLNEEVEKQYRDLIRDILEYNPDVYLFLGNPLPSSAYTYVKEDDRNVWIRGFIKQLCEEKAANGYNVNFVDFSTSAIDWTVEDWDQAVTDHVHPSATGNVKVANQWYNAIKPTIDSIIEAKGYDA